MKRPSPHGRTAIVSFHSHGDRSFLDDRDHTLLSGDLREYGLENDLVLVVLDPAGGEGPAGAAAELRLIEILGSYDLILFERVWSMELIKRLREATPHAVWACWDGEHVLSQPPVDWVCRGQARDVVPEFVAFMRGRLALPPFECKVAKGALFLPLDGAERAPPRSRPFRPNLRPILVNPEALPAFRTYSVMGNKGCPYQVDARTNPLYAGVQIPAEKGRGCAFCTTGNEYIGAPNEQTAASVFEQITYVRTHSTEYQYIVLLDQNPFGYLTELIESLEKEGGAPFTLLIETRGDWFLRSRRRFERALEAARRADITLAPFLVGIENFSDAELERFNKGMSAAQNIEFLETLWQWQERYAPAMTLEHAAFGFILLSPWTTLKDLEINLQGIRRTRLDRLRGSLLVSRARLYPDTALYWLAARDGLLEETFESAEENNSARYGYYPSTPWRYRDALVARFSSLAAELTRMLGSRDQVLVFETLLEMLAQSPEPENLRAEDILARLKPPIKGHAVSPELKARFERLIAPLELQKPFAGGWTLGSLVSTPRGLGIELLHPREGGFTVGLTLRREAPCFASSRHYNITHSGASLTPPQRHALELLSSAIVSNDR